jgi:hypothetical protein
VAGAILVGILFLALSLVGTESIPKAELLQQAEAAFGAGVKLRDEPDKARPLFREAASCYEELRRGGADNADLYRNQGNSQLLAGDLAGAILSYRRGLRLAPADLDLRANLAYAREQIAYPGPGDFGRPPQENRPPWLPYLSSRQRVLLFFCSYSLGWLGIVRWWMVRRAAPWRVGLTAFGLASLVAASLVVEAWSERQESLHPLVVIARDGVRLLKGNGALYPPRFGTPLYRGVEARLRFERGDWLQIELAGGQMGWVPRAAALLDMPTVSGERGASAP